MYPILFQKWGITIYTYGVCMAVAFLCGILISIRLARFLKIKSADVMDLSIVIVVSSLIGARILYIIVNLEYFKKYPLETIMLHHGGLVYYGGLIGAIIGSGIFVYVKKLNFFDLADIMGVAVPLGQGFGRIGCFFNGCCYGKLISPDYSGSWLLNLFQKWGCARIPTQLLSSLFAFLTFVVLYFLFKRRRYPGEIFSLYIIIYSVNRFLIEFLRGDDRGAYIMGFSVSQIISIALFITGSIMLLRLKKRNETYSRRK